MASKLQQRCCYALFLLLILTGPILVRSQDVQFERIATSGGASLGTINAIIQDRYGFLWLGTANGLLRYDGYDFKIFKHDPADSTSISGNHIWSICEDRTGDLWIGTSRRGLCRYVRGEDRFVRYRHDPNDTTSLGGDVEVPWVYRDRTDQIWIALWEFGLDRYERAPDRFLHHRIPIKDEEGVPRQSVHRIYEDRTGTLWIGTKRGLVRLDRDRQTFRLYQHDPSDPRSLGGNYIYAILEDRDDNLWVGALDGGLSRYDRPTDTFTVYRHDPDNPQSLSSDAVSAVCVDSLGFLWIGTHDRGLNRLDPATGAISRFFSTPENPSSISTNQITSLYVDRAGVLWIGTAGKGLNRYHPSRRKFVHYRHQAGKPGSLSGDIVDAILETREGDIWVGTAGNGLNRYDPKKRKFIHYQHNLDNEHSLSSNFVSALAEDARGYLWIGTYDGGLNRLHLKSEKITRVAGDHEDLKLINELLMDRRGHLWIGTDGNGLNVYDTEREVFVYSGSDSTSPFYDKRHVFALYEDTDGNIWIGVWGEGVCRYDPATGDLTTYKHEPDNPTSLSSDAVVSISEDASGNYWFGTWGEGLNCLPADSQTFTRYTSADGLPNDNIYGILADQQDRIWVSTSNGLAKYDPRADVWRVYDQGDDIQSPEFRQGAYHQGRSGRFYFGGVHGFNTFQPEEVVDNPHVPTIVLTSFKIHEREVAPRKLDASLENLNAVILSHHENYLSFEFAALEFTHPQKNQYAYMLEGFDKDWIDSGSRRHAVYTNLDPGEYVFRARGSNSDGVWNEEGLAIRLTIKPPPWQTWWAYTIYVLLAGGLLYGIRKYELKRIGLTNELKLKRMEAQKLYEVDQIKSRFFANISHEFRTPLTLILGPLENLLQTTTQAKLRNQYKIMLGNGRRLLHLINQLLDLAKLEAGSMKLQAKSENIVPIVRNMVASFATLAERKQIRLQFKTAEQRLIVHFDRDKLEKCLNNLLSNALKFTPEGGRVTVAVAVAGGRGSKQLAVGSNQLSVSSNQLSVKNRLLTGHCLLITVTDTGIGMTPDQLDKIFDRFYQVEHAHSQEREGTGIGLALTKELIELHGGEIQVTSTPWKGSTFVVRLPMAGEEPEPEKEAVVDNSDAGYQMPDAGYQMPDQPAIENEEEPSHVEREVAYSDQPVVLIVEDHRDMRAYVRETLCDRYQILEASKGLEGLNLALDTVPNLIVTDVMMPGMDGYELCRHLKTDERTSHIPVILLTARAAEDSKITGLETGADDYVTKPFNAQELRTRISNLIEQRRKLRQRFSRQVTLQPGDLAITTADELFLKRVMAIVDEHLSDADFGVQAFAQKVRLSRVQLHRKLKALTDQSASEFIRIMRLRAAARLLEQGKYTVTEIAYEVGFNNLSYFAKCFQEQFGVLPSEYKKTSGHK